MELLSCRTRPRHPFHAAYSHRKVNTFLLLLACPTFSTTSALPTNWFQFEKKKREGKQEKGEGRTSSQRTPKQINQSHIFLHAVFFHRVTSWQREVDVREKEKYRGEKERVNGWLEHAWSPRSIMISGSLLMETSG